MLISLTTIGISEFYYRQQLIQQHLDRAVMLAIKNLPDYFQAQEVVNNYLKSKQIDFNQTAVEFNDNQVTLRYNSDYQLNFADYFLDLKIPLRVASQAEVRKQSINLIIDLASKVTPEEYENWPTAQFIDSYFNLYHDYASDAHSLTRQCFNQDFNLMKLVALEIVNHYQVNQQGELTIWGSNKNSVGLLPIKAGAYGDNFDYCSAAAWNELLEANYQFPFSSNFTEQIVDLNTGKLRPEYLTSRTVSEIVWGLGQDKFTFNLPLALEQIFKRLVENINSQTNQKIIIVASQPPQNFDQDSLRTQLESRFEKIASIIPEGEKINFYYLIIKQQINLDDYRWQEVLTKAVDRFSSKILLENLILNDQQELSHFVNNFIQARQNYVLSK